MGKFAVIETEVTGTQIVSLGILKWFVSEAVGPFVSRLRAQPGKDIWLMGGGDIIASFLDEQAIDDEAAPDILRSAVPRRRS